MTPTNCKNPSLPKVVVVLSGGLDSTVLAWSLAQSDSYNLIGAVTVNYGQRHRFEIVQAEKTCNNLNVPQWVIDISDYGAVVGQASALTGDKLKVPDGHYAEDSMKATVVPGRNLVLLSIVAGVAVAKGAQFIAYGAHSGDHAIYPDCRPEFVDALDKALALADYAPAHIMRPFIGMTKADIVKLGLSINADMKDTWSCYKGNSSFIKPTACGRCGTCVERLEAFDIAGVVDPINYADRTFYKSVVKPRA